MADCERGLGRPEKALAMAAGPDVGKLDAGGRVEMLIVASGARRDLGQPEAAAAAPAGSRAEATTASCLVGPAVLRLRRGAARLRARRGGAGLVRSRGRRGRGRRDRCRRPGRRAAGRDAAGRGRRDGRRRARHHRRRLTRSGPGSTWAGPGRRLRPQDERGGVLIHRSVAHPPVGVAQPRSSKARDLRAPAVERGEQRGGQQDECPAGGGRRARQRGAPGRAARRRAGAPRAAQR